MEESILKSTKQILGVEPTDPSFDLDIMTHINGAFSTLTQLGIGPEVGFVIEDENKKWETFTEVPLHWMSQVKIFIFLKTRILFDPPESAAILAAFERQITELEWRLSTAREGRDWKDPDPPGAEESEVVISS
jgi:hypothetical protein